MIKVHCDISFDGNPPGNAKGTRHVPKTYVFAGVIADPSTWASVERKWKQVNGAYHVPRFHAAHLNARTHEYEGWSRNKQKQYSGELLDILAAQGKRIEAVTCGMLADEYRVVISPEGQRKLGAPYLACFNSCISLLAMALDKLNYPPDDQLAVLLDADEGYTDAISSFLSMKSNPAFQHRSRLATCAVACMEDVVSMQPADLVAYEAFRRLHAHRLETTSLRYPLTSLMSSNTVTERYFSKESLSKMKEEIETTPAPDGRLVIIPAS